MRRWAGKDKLEALRKTEKVSGNEWWLLQDFWTGANGILDTYYVSKHPPSELVRPSSPFLLLSQLAVVSIHHASSSSSS